jgi:hypothetical protein
MVPDSVKPSPHPSEVDMNLSRPLSRLVRTTATGALGVAAVEGGRRLLTPTRVRAGAVTATAWALRGQRQAETRAESVRLGGADILAEARERVGETAPVPGLVEHDHEH